MENYDKSEKFIELVAINKPSTPETAKIAKRAVALMIGGLSIFATAVKAMGDGNFNNDSQAIIALDTLPVDATINTTTTVLGVDPTSPDTTIQDGTTTTTVLGVDPTSPDTTIQDGTTTTIPESTSTVPNSSPTTTLFVIPTTTTIPEKGLELDTYDNDQNNILEIGQYVTYKVIVNNLDSKSKTLDVKSSFLDTIAITNIDNLTYRGCGSPVNNSGPKHVWLDQAEISPLGTCEVTFDGIVYWPDQTAQQYAKVYEYSTGRNYTKYSDLLRS